MKSTMKYTEVVRRAQSEIKERTGYGNRNITYVSCPTWENGDQINLWTYWQGYQLKDIDEKGVDILLVGQDWGNPCIERNVELLKRIEKIQEGYENIKYISTLSPTDKMLCELFKVFGENIDIASIDLGMRLFFTNYSLGYRSGSETGGMTKSLMRMDSDLFDDLVEAIHPKIIICLGKITYEMVSGHPVRDFSNTLKRGEPFESRSFKNPAVRVFGVGHCGALGSLNAGGVSKMKETWMRIAEIYANEIN